MNARARRGRPGENIIIDTFVRDVSERKNAETALMASEQKYRHLFDHAGEGILIMDDQLVIAGANYAAEELFGGTSHECLTGMPLSERLGSTSCLTPEKLRSWSRHSSTGVVRKEMGLFRLDGTKIFVSATIKFNSDDCCYQVILTDITTRRQTEESLRLAKESAESASKAKSDFLANMSHEIRTPLNGMMGMLQLLAETQLSEDQREYVDCGIVSCKRLTQLLGDILDLSKIEAGRMDVFHETLDMHTILNSIENLFGMSARHKGLSLRVNVSSDTPANLFGDSIKLQQIFNNLVGNAIKFTQKGTVQVEAYPLPSQNSDNVKILFSVTDTGDGMQTDKLDHLFNAFTQADSSFTRGYQGAGLGLSIVRRLVHLMGGTIYVESELGKGTAIHFCLPFKIGPTVNNNTKSIESRFETGIDTRRILIVEDDSVNRIFLKRTLAKRNCTVQVAENGDIALKVLAKFDFDIVLMDIHMPVMGGVEATRAIRAGEVGEDKRGVPIVAVTACAMQEDKEAFLHAGMDGYLPKPVDVKSLFGVLDGLMPPAALAHR
jgi:PAS domain S-box-containing protein